MRSLPALLITLLLLSFSPLDVAAQGQDSTDNADASPLTQEDVDFYRDVARQARAEINAEILTIQEALDDPDSVVVPTSRGPLVIPIGRLVALLQFDSLIRDRGDETGFDPVDAWLQLGMPMESPPNLRELTAGDVLRLRDLKIAFDKAANARIEELLREKDEVALFESWLDQEPVVATPGEPAPDVLALAEGPYPDACIFTSGYFLDQSKIGETQVLAWREDDFDPSWARYSYAVATPDEDAEDPNHRIEKMRQDVAAIDGATVVFDGSFNGFCSWAAATCPGTNPLVAGEPVCEDGQPVLN